MKLATEATSNPNAIWKYIMNSKSRFTDSDMEQAVVLGNFFSCVFTVEPDGDIPHIPPVELRHMEELAINEQMVVLWYSNC